MKKDLMSTALQLLDRCLRYGVIETALVRMSKNDRYSHFEFTLNGATRSPDRGGPSYNERGQLDFQAVLSSSFLIRQAISLATKGFMISSTANSAVVLGVTFSENHVHMT